MKRQDTAEFLIERLELDREKTMEFFGAISEEDWERTVYSEGTSWTVRQVLAHLAAAEDAVARLIDHVVSGGGGVPEDFDLDRYNERRVRDLTEQSPAELIQIFAERRAQTIAQVASYGERELRLQGRHPFLGIAPVIEMIKLMYRHTQIHQRDLRRALTAAASSDVV